MQGVALNRDDLDEVVNFVIPLIQQVRQPLFPLETKELIDGGTPHVGINEQYRFTRLGQGDRQIAGNRGLAVAGFGTADEDDFMPIAPRRSQEMRSDPASTFGQK